MADRAQKFEDLIAWQKSRVLRKDIAALVRGPAFRPHQYLAEQMRRAAHSIKSNITEGFGRAGPREFHRFLSTARGSTTELQSHLYTALDDRLISQDVFDRHYAQSDEVLRIVTALRQSVGRKLTAAPNP